MRHMTQKEEAFEFARQRAQANSTDYRVIELDNGYFAVGTMKKVDFYYPEASGWNFRYRY